MQNCSFIQNTLELLIYLITPVTASKIAQVDCCGWDNHDKWFRMIFHYMSRRDPCFLCRCKNRNCWLEWLVMVGGGADIFNLIANSPKCSHNLVGFPNWHVSGCQLGEETPVHSPIWLWRLLEPSNLVAPPKKYTFRIGTFIESIFALDSSFRSAVVAEV